MSYKQDFDIDIPADERVGIVDPSTQMGKDTGKSILVEAP
jgi:hypothetical protein